MKRRILIPLISAMVLLVSTSGYLLYELRDKNGENSFLRGQAIYLEEKISNLNIELDKYDGVDLAQLKLMCHDKAHKAYSKYISDNSAATKNGLVTTFYPKSPAVITEATKTLDEAKINCDTQFPS